MIGEGGWPPATFRSSAPARTTDQEETEMAHPATFTADDLARLPEIVAADLAPDGGTVVYAASTTDGTTTLERTQLWLLEPGGEPVLLSESDKSQGAPSFSPDGTRIAYLQHVGEKPQLAVLTTADRSTEVLTDFPRGVGAGAPRWSPDGTTLAFTASDAPVREPGRPYRVTRPVWRRDALGLIDDVNADLWTIPADGGTATRLTFHDGVVAQVQWSPDGTALLYDCFAEPSTAVVTLHTVTADGAHTHVVLSADYLVYPPRGCPTGESCAPRAGMSTSDSTWPCTTRPPAPTRPSTSRCPARSAASCR
jgi:Tol biopolymer transport system component